MKNISNWQDFVSTYKADNRIFKVNEEVLYFLKNSPILAVTTEKVFDEIEQQKTDVDIVAYNNGVFVWDSREIFYYEKYGMPLSDDFINYLMR